MKRKIFFALDVDSVEEANHWMKRFEAFPLGYKIGYELFLKAGPKHVQTWCAKGHEIFLDLKLFDIPRTMFQAAQRIRTMGVQWATFHLSSGLESTQAFKEGLGSDVISVGVSVLTSVSEKQWKERSNIWGKGSLQNRVESLVALGVEAGVSYFVCSALDLVFLKKKWPTLFFITPGIRLVSDPNAWQDQKRVMSPKEAFSAGAFALVLGRAVRMAPNPLKVLEKVFGFLES